MTQDSFSVSICMDDEDHYDKQRLSFFFWLSNDNIENDDEERTLKLL